MSSAADTECVAPHIVCIKFDVAQWGIHRESTSYSIALNHLQAEECERIERFRFENDAKRALAGRLIARRQLTSMMMLKSSRDLYLCRSSKNKPMVDREHHPHSSIDFNISHHGRWVIFVAAYDAHMQSSPPSGDKDPDPGKTRGAGFRVGCDVMPLKLAVDEKELYPSVDDYLATFESYFSVDEWQRIVDNRFSPEQRVQRFYSYWTLKEAVLKATENGLSFDLKTIEFCDVPDPWCLPRSLVKDLHACLDDDTGGDGVLKVTTKASGTGPLAEEFETPVKQVLEEEAQHASLKFIGPNAHVSNSEWKLYQCLLDDEYIASVAVSIDTDRYSSSALQRTLEFREVEASDLAL